jgi:hypothetical protein
MLSVRGKENSTLMTAKDRAVARWVKTVRFVDRQVTRAYQLHAVLRDELLFAYTPPAHRTDVTALAYSGGPALYGPGSRHFESGLLEWERTALALMNVGPRSRVLIGGIGGGRELPEVARMASHVVAFEPSAALYEFARGAAEALPNVAVHHASYDDLVDAVAGRGGPLEGALGPYDAVILGRGSFGHVTDETAQLALLNALRESSPDAPVLLSVTLRRAPGDLGNSVGARRALRGVLGRLGGRPVRPGLRYEDRCGFLYRFTEAEIRELSQQTRYRVGELALSPYALRGGSAPAHAVLFPE